MREKLITRGSFILIIFILIICYRGNLREIIFDKIIIIVIDIIIIYLFIVIVEIFCKCRFKYLKLI